MNELGTVFYLEPLNQQATDIVRANRDRACANPDIAPESLLLRIGLDQVRKSPPHLVRFGRRGCNDVILDQRFPRNDQCYFDFHKETGELLLHDLSEDGDTNLYEIDVEDRQDDEPPKVSLLQSKPRRCAVVLTRDPYRSNCERKYRFAMRKAKFHLIPRITQDSQDETRFADQRLAFVGQRDPEQTLEGTMEYLIKLGLQSEALTSTYKSQSTITYSRPNTRYKTSLEPGKDEVIRYVKLGPLGMGGQGEVHRVVNISTGAHCACKIVAVKAMPALNINSANDFRAKVEREVKLVQDLNHAHLVPYTHTQGFKFGQNIEIFMPIYESNLHALIQQHRPNVCEGARRHVPQAILDITSNMLCQILDALDYLHTHDPQIIHRDLKPANILVHHGKFLLTDFGIAKAVDTSSTMVGTALYMAPEVFESAEQTPKVDIFGLGATVVACLKAFPADARTKYTHWQPWHEHLRKTLLEELAPLLDKLAPLPDGPNQLVPLLMSMLDHFAHRRPTARQLLDPLVNQPAHASSENPQSDIIRPDSGVSPPPTQADETRIFTPMDWTRTRASALHPRNPQPPQQGQIMQPPKPNAGGVPSSKASTRRSARLESRAKRFVKSAQSVDGRQEGRNKSSQDGRGGPSRPAGVPSRSSRRTTRSTSKISKSILKAPEIRALLGD